MKRNNSDEKPLTDRPMQEVIEEAAREAYSKMCDRNRRMGWPVITVEYLREERLRKAAKNDKDS